MDALQRLQNWFIMHCNGDWEHDYGVHIDTLDNPGWAVKINLKDTNLEKAVLPYQLTERTPMNWVSWKIEDGYFEAFGGPGNLSELLLYFLEILLPQQGDKAYEYKVHIPLTDYLGLIWRVANAVMVNESQLRITRFPEPEKPASYIISGENAYEAFEKLEATSLVDAQPQAHVDDIITVAIEEHQFGTDLVYKAHIVG